MEQEHEELLDLEQLKNLCLEKKIFHVTVRSGSKKPLDLEQILERINKLAEGLDRNYVKIHLVVHKVIMGMYDGIDTSTLDNLAAETCAYMNIIHPSYSQLAARIAVNNLHKQTKEDFHETIKDLYTYWDDNTRRDCSLIADDVMQIVEENKEEIQKTIDYERDYTYDYFGFKTLEKSYLLKINGKIHERPQTMLMRVSIGIHKKDLKSAFETYNLMSEKWFTHATPTLFNSGTRLPQMSSCFLLDMQSDSIMGIYDTLKQCAIISKYAGGIGLAVSSIRANGSYIKGSNGNSNGIIPMLKVYNQTARYADQGGGRRKGAFAIYLEPWHADIFEFLQLRKNNGVEENRCRDLFLALWIPDLFMKRVINDEEWTTMCPNECKGLQDVFGDEFEQLYTQYEKEGKGRKTFKARVLWQEVIDSQIETGTPYMLYKDACNKKSNQQNLGCIKSSNLCTEIIQYTDANEVAVCNLASINLQKFVTEKGEYDYDKLFQIAKTCTINLNKVIDENYYPIKQAETSNMRNRPIGIGVQGLADAFMRMNIKYESETAMKMNEKIFETIYFGACTASMELAKVQGPYESYKGSPASKGQLQFDLWNYKPQNGYDWDGLKEQIKEHGMRNSLLIAPMPTASTSQILGNNESFEPYTANLYTRRVLAGEFVCINKHLVQDLIKNNLWNADIKNKLLAHNGSIQNIQEIPKDIQELYKTVWEISQKQVINLAISRGPFIDQSQSLNIHIESPNYSKMCSVHFYAWEKGLKTGMYYLRTRPAVDPIKFTVDVKTLLQDAGNIQIEDKNSLVRKADDKENDEMIEKKRKLDETGNWCPLKKKKQQEQEKEQDEPCFSCGS